MWRTVAVVVFGWVAAAVVVGVSYLALGTEWIAISVGVLLCFVFAIVLSLLHRAVWLAVLSLGPGLFVLVGAVQYAPEAALEQRGIRASVVVVEDSAAGASDEPHRLTLRSSDGSELAEKLEYDSSYSGVPDVDDRLEVIRDPEGTVGMEQADDVDAANRLGGLIAGVVLWTLMVLLAGRRGHVRRRRGLESSFADLA
ncbi:hypothetical protein E2651_23980 [Streptomyces sp. MZ04]|nr:hypothetical protein [Streptomyces sp. MZ04]TGB06032.1 hypothetical protein E2651_23980 [Streptomyces sp. MZ04]